MVTNQHVSPRRLPQLCQYLREKEAGREVLLLLFLLFPMVFDPKLVISFGPDFVSHFDE